MIRRASKQHRVNVGVVGRPAPQVAQRAAAAPKTEVSTFTAAARTRASNDHSGGMRHSFSGKLPDGEQ